MPPLCRAQHWLLAAAAIALGFAPAIAQAQTWTEDAFEDFVDGQLDASGQNLYVSRDGKVRTIHRFDLNGDGFLDLMFNCTHDEYGFVPAAQCTVGPNRRLRSSPLAVEGSRGVVLADLNRDGWLDLALCPNSSGIQHPRRFVTLIYGGPDGWSSRRSNGILPVRQAETLVVADLNRDRWPDLVILNGEAWLRGQPAGRIVRVYWGGKEGFLLARRLDVGVPGALDLAATDLDGDGASDVAVLTSHKQVHVFWSRPAGPTPSELVDTVLALPDGGAQCLVAADVDGDGNADLVMGTSKGVVHLVRGRAGRDWSAPEVVPASDAAHVSVGDLDGDGRADLVLTKLSLAHAAGGEVTGAGKDVADVVRILWGDAAGFSTAHSTNLAVRFAAATAVGDLDGDGRADLAVAVYQTAKTFAAESVVLFNEGERRFRRAGRGIRTEGATDVAIAPAKDPLPARAVFCNSRGGTLHENVPLLVYWGGADGFEAKRRWEIPFASGYESSAADLNADGLVDLIAMNSGHGGRGGTGGQLGANIFWGGPEGFDVEKRRTALQHYGLWASNVADLNRDGWLDLILGKFASDAEGKDEELIIYYGAAGGFDAARRTVVASPGRSGGCAVADFNRDGWLDIACTSYSRDRTRIFWGSREGFAAERQKGLDVPSPIGLETADLNADGWLDLIVGSYIDRLAGHHDTGTVIFWGSAEGFRPWDAQRLPGWTATGHTVADFDGDGHLDLFSPHYHGELTRESMPCYLYWGGPEGFHPRRRTILVGDSSDDALAGDFDRDGRLDLAVVCHTVDGDHRAFSRVYYNDGRRFANPRCVMLPTHGAHWMWLQDMGHIYDRSWRQRYTSSVMRWVRAVKGGTLRAEADVPAGTKLTFTVRAAANETGLPRRPWRAVTDGRFALAPADRCLQYRATFESDNGDRYPVLDRVTVRLRVD